MFVLAGRTDLTAWHLARAKKVPIKEIEASIKSGQNKIAQWLKLLSLVEAALELRLTGCNICGKANCNKITCTDVLEVEKKVEIETALNYTLSAPIWRYLADKYPELLVVKQQELTL